MKKTITAAFLLSLVGLLSCGGGGGGGGDEASNDSASAPPAETPAFGAGQHLIGQDIAPGRYYSDPGVGCFWERLSGLGGTTGETIANQFINFDSPQEIVDIEAGDLAFSTDSDCGNWFTTPRQGAQNGIIPPGNWLVGSQIAPGTYRANAADGCFWERLRNFSGGSGATIANDFVSGGGAELVTISATDVGFSTDADCGTWTRVQSAAGRELPGAALDQSLESIEQNRAVNRQQEQARR